LVRWYPRGWRERYGEEFTELLIADIDERPRCPGRTLDVIRGGLTARLTAAGLGDGPLERGERVRASLAALGAALAVFVAFGVGLWSQLTIGWQWAAPDTPLIVVAMKVMSGALVALAVLAIVGAAPIAWATVRSLLAPGGGRLIGPFALFLVGATVLVIGSRHFAHGWPGTGGRPWSDKSLVPRSVASFAWAATLSITSYWAHPHKLGAFPAAEVGWMAIAPLAIVSIAVGGILLVRRAVLSPAIVRHEARVGRAATIAMLVFLCGAICRVAGSDTGPRRLFAFGMIDVLDVVVMALAVACALGIDRRLRAATRLASPPG
jgi:hypothetical protein